MGCTPKGHCNASNDAMPTDAVSTDAVSTDVVSNDVVSNDEVPIDAQRNAAHDAHTETQRSSDAAFSTSRCGSDEKQVAPRSMSVLALAVSYPRLPSARSIPGTPLITLPWRCCSQGWIEPGVDPGTFRHLGGARLGGSRDLLRPCSSKGCVLAQHPDPLYLPLTI